MLVLSIEILPKMFCIYLYQHFIKQYKNTGKCFNKCHNNKQFIPRAYMFIIHKITQNNTQVHLF